MTLLLLFKAKLEKIMRRHWKDSRVKREAAEGCHIHDGDRDGLVMMATSCWVPAMKRQGEVRQRWVRCSRNQQKVRKMLASWVRSGMPPVRMWPSGKA